MLEFRRLPQWSGRIRWCSTATACPETSPSSGRRRSTRAARRAGTLGFTRDGTRCHPPSEWANELAPSLQFDVARQPKTRKNRVHFDVNVTDHADWIASRDGLLAMGAVVCDPAEFDLDMPSYGENFAIMRDPEGNEFCLQATSEPHGA